MVFKRSRGANVPICVSLCPSYCVCLGLFLCLCLCFCQCPNEYEMVFKRSRGANVPIKKSPRSEWLPHCQDSWEKTQHLPSRQILVLRSLRTGVFLLMFLPILCPSKICLVSKIKKTGAFFTSAALSQDIPGSRKA